MSPGELVVKVIDVCGNRSATIARVESVEAGVVRLVDSGLIYGLDGGEEIGPMIPGCTSYLVPFDGGEVERWGLMSLAEEVLS